MCDLTFSFRQPFVSSRVPSVSEDMAREALLKFVGKKWTYSSKPARNLVFKDLKPYTVYRYRLETYTESRSSAWDCEPHTDQFVDGPQYGQSPPPWAVAVEGPPMYTDLTQKVRVPHSSFVKVSAPGNTLVRMLDQHVTGVMGEEGCDVITAMEEKECNHCHAKGHRCCTSCSGHRNLMHYIVLTITWKNHVFEFIPDRVPDFPVKKFEKVSGDPFFIDESILVYPIVGFPDQDICSESRRIIEEHLNKFSSMSRILQQRQTIEVVPLTQAFYSYNGKNYDYFVFGFENKVHAPKYPSSCSIL
ncbi:protein SSUH2-like [Scleropages formosus]|uniref:Protein SSUH2-like n=1 Tax=Scleropages formosus TaxID=113540 RepID=A0A0P7USI2_SCLFO|nr:protein SSUH2-like [Scleropages formosus]